jgi:hypothetical protein
MRTTRRVISISLYLLLGGGGEEVVEKTPNEPRAAPAPSPVVTSRPAATITRSSGGS